MGKVPIWNPIFLLFFLSVSGIQKNSFCLCLFLVFHHTTSSSFSIFYFSRYLGLQLCFYLRTHLGMTFWHLGSDIGKTWLLPLSPGRPVELTVRTGSGGPSSHLTIPWLCFTQLCWPDLDTNPCDLEVDYTSNRTRSCMAQMEEEQNSSWWTDHCQEK